MSPDVGPGGTNYTYGDKPVVFVSWYDAARFANWVNNGATAGASTETGAYTMANGVSVSRNAGCNLVSANRKPVVQGRLLRRRSRRVLRLPHQIEHGAEQ